MRIVSLSLWAITLNVNRLEFLPQLYTITGERSDRWTPWCQQDAHISLMLIHRLKIMGWKKYSVLDIRDCKGGHKFLSNKINILYEIVLTDIGN